MRRYRAAGLGEPGLVGDGDAGVVLDQASPGFLVQAFDIPLLADFQRAVTVDFQHVFQADNLAHHLAVPFQRGDEGGQGDGAGFQGSRKDR